MLSLSVVVSSADVMRTVWFSAIWASVNANVPPGHLAPQTVGRRPRASAGSRALVLDGEGVDLQRGVIGLVNSAIALGGQQTLIAVFDGEQEVRVVAGTIQRNKLDLAVNQGPVG